jgi:hypothetical protein
VKERDKKFIYITITKLLKEACLVFYNPALQYNTFVKERNNNAKFK